MVDGADRARFVALQRYAAEAYTHFLTKQYATGEQDSLLTRSFLVAERGKARSFLDDMVASLAGLKEEGSKELVQLQRDLLSVIAEIRADIQSESRYADADREAIEEWRTELGDFEDQYEQVRRTLREENPRYSDLNDPQLSSVSDVQEFLPEDGTTMLTYAVGDSSSTLWAISARETQMFGLPSRMELSAAVDAFRFALADPTSSNIEGVTGAGHQLFSMLIEPANALVKASDHLIIVPDDILNYIPFGALVTDSHEAESFSDVPFLVKDLHVSYAQSASVLDLIVSGRESRARRPDKILLTIGDPVFSNPTSSDISTNDQVRSGAFLDPLPFTAAEVTSITALFEDAEVDMYLQESASEPTLKSSLSSNSYRFVHLATHGLIDEDAPDFSSVVFSSSSDDSEDGYLHAAEIFNLNLDTELVVLSACETGLGQLIRGEGMVGLTRAFMYAGARSLVVSLWNVSDRSTSELMKQFYGEMMEFGADKSSALRHAKLDLLSREESAHPFHWAPFVLIGDWK